MKRFGVLLASAALGAAVAASGPALAFGGGHGVRAIGVGEDDGELFATEAGGFAESRGDAVGDDVGDLAEAVIAVDVAEEVVVLLGQIAAFDHDIQVLLIPC